MSEHAPDPAAPPSWEEGRVSAPERPALVSNLPEERVLPRPRRVLVACVLVLAAAAGLLGATGFAALQFGEIRDALITTMPADVIEDYADDDTKLAANVMLGATAGLLLVSTLGQCVAIGSLVRRRSAAARVLFTVVAVLGAPLALLSAIVREAGSLDLLVVAVTATSVLVAAGIVCTPAVTRWVRQREPRRTIPLADAAAG